MSILTKQQYGESLAVNSSYSGVEILQNEELVQYFSTKTRDRFNDIEGTAELMQAFGGVATTGFETATLSDIFKNTAPPKPWQIGESFAECYLEDYCSARFPYPTTRDAKNPKANLAGADLVGYYYNGSDTMFLFGEVKTSNDKSTPPGVVTGRHGIKEQLKNLITDKCKSSFLVKWLGLKMKDLPDNNKDKIDYKNALRQYVSSCKEKMKIVGILIRDIVPAKKDLESKYVELNSILPSLTILELLGIYFPIQIDAFAQTAKLI